MSIVISPGMFRLLLAGCVLLNHLSRFEVGRLGVILFFVLSGYWISDLWERQRRSAAPGVSIFLLNRFLRIWPLYFLSVLGAVWLNDSSLGLASVTLFGVASAPGPLPLGVEWSLDIEAQFYLLLPFLVMHRISAWWIIPAVIAGWSILDYSGISTVLMHIPAFAAGIWLFRTRDRPISFGPGTSLLIFGAVTLLVAAWEPSRALLDSRVPNPVHSDIFAMFWGAALLPYIAHSLRVRSTPFDRHLGNL